nr:MAG TPA: hypothetical protein [Microviridae sp.]
MNCTAKRIGIARRFERCLRGERKLNVVYKF